MTDCILFPPPLNYLCEMNMKLDQKNDTLKSQLYITAGVVGGFMFILLLLIIGLFVKLNKLLPGNVLILRDENDLQIPMPPHISMDVFSSRLHENTPPKSQPSAPSPPISEYDTDYNTPLDRHSSGPKKVRFLPRILPGLRQNKSSDI